MSLYINLLEEKKHTTFAGEIQKIMRQVNLHIEGVPNPSAIKFVLENGVLTQEEFEFVSYAETGYSPLARRLMMFRYIERVLIHKNYITLIKSSAPASPEWEEVLPELRQAVISHLSANEPILYLGMKPVAHAKTEDVMATLAQQIMDVYVRPATQEDGGDILVKSLENGELKLTLKGACKGCPYIHETVGKGIVPLMQEHVPDIKKITWE